MIQDIAPHKFDNQYREGMVPQSDNPILIFAGKKMESIMVRINEGRISFPTMAEMPDGLIYTYMFSVDDMPCFSVMEEEISSLNLPADLEPVDSRKLLFFFTGSWNPTEFHEPFACFWRQRAEAVRSCL